MRTRCRVRARDAPLPGRSGASSAGSAAPRVRGVAARAVVPRTHAMHELLAICERFGTDRGEVLSGLH
jgi:hypothetical protein